MFVKSLPLLPRVLGWFAQAAGSGQLVIGRSLLCVRLPPGCPMSYLKVTFLDNHLSAIWPVFFFFSCKMGVSLGTLSEPFLPLWGWPSLPPLAPESFRNPPGLTEIEKGNALSCPLHLGHKLLLRTRRPAWHSQLRSRHAPYHPAAHWRSLLFLGLSPTPAGCSEGGPSSQAPNTGTGYWLGWGVDTDETGVRPNSTALPPWALGSASRPLGVAGLQELLGQVPACWQCRL